MQHTPQELKEKLLKAVDQDHNVVDMPTVLEVFSILEEHSISREILEQTRMGLHINEIRRKTENKDLAKRARQLLRAWQKLVHAGPNVPGTASPAPPTPHTVNGEGLAGGRRVGNGVSGKHAQLLSARDSEAKPASPASRPATPASGGRLTYSPSGLAYSRPGTPSATAAGSFTPVSATSRLSPKTGLRPVPGGHIVSPALSTHSGGSQTSPGLPQLHSHGSQPGKRTVGSSSRPGTPTDTLSKTNSANKRRRRDRDSPGADQHHPKNLAASCDTSLNSCESSSNPIPPSTPCTGGIKLTIKHDRTLNGLVSHTKVVDTSQNGTDPSHNSSTHDFSRTPTLPSASTPSLDAINSRQGSFASKRNASSLSLKTDYLDRGSTSGDGIPKPLERTHSSASLIASRTPKVKTTAQLLKELHESGGLKLRSSETVTRIALNQIEKEDDPDEVSVVPAGAKPRPRRKPVTHSMLPPTPSDKTLSQTKTERIQKFLQTSVTPSPSVVPSPDPDLSTLLQLEPALEAEEELDVVDMDTYDDHLQPGSDHDIDVDRSPVGSVPGEVLLEGRSKEEQERFLRDPWSFLPKLEDSLVVDSDSDADEEITDLLIEQRGHVTDEMVERLHNEEWAGVNGHYDYQNYWHDWTVCYSMPAYQGHLLHLLPYVNVDE